MNEQNEKFLRELNEAIGPMLVAEQDGEVFKVRLRETPMLHSAMLNVSKQFISLVGEMGWKHFGLKPMFNNTMTTWWF